VKALLQNTWFALLISIFATLSFSTEIINHTGLLIILWCFTGLLLLIIGRPFRKPSGGLVLFVSVFLMAAVSFLYSENQHEAAAKLERKLSLILFPLLLFYGPVPGQRFVAAFLKAFVAGCGITALYCIAVGISKLVLHNDSAYLFYRIMSATVGMHPVYLSMYYCMALGLLLFHPLFGSPTARRPFYWAMIALFSVAIVLLSSRMAMFILLAAIAVTGYRLMTTRLRRPAALAATAGLSLLVVLIALLPYRNRVRLAEIFVSKSQPVSGSELSGAEARTYIWSCAMELIAKNPIAGVGIGDGEDELDACYAARGYTFLTGIDDMRFNAHNQFLENWLTQGIAGLVVLVSSLVYPFVRAVRRGNVIYCVFVLIFCGFALTESLLERQSGIVFFAIMNSVLYFFPEEPPGLLERAKV
jgi:O-antigen ligase